MNNLLESAVAAHGGMNRWTQVKSITVDVVGGAPSMLYATDYRDVDGIIIPTTRRGYAWQGDYQLVPEPLLVAIDMGEITVR
jgi:hypothetical protein